MGRIRSIKPEFPQSESIGKLSRDARLLFIQIWTLVDDEGRTRGASRMLASLLYPYDSDAPKLIDGWLDELEQGGHIQRYLAEGGTYLQVLNFLEHQKIDHPSKSKLPAFNESSLVLANPRESSRLIKEGIKEEEAPPPVMELPAIGGSSFAVGQIQVDRWQELYCGTDVMQELRKMVGWLESNSTKRKTLKGTPAFVASWLARAQDKGGSPNLLLGNGRHPPPSPASEEYERKVKEIMAERTVRA